MALSDLLPIGNIWKGQYRRGSEALLLCQVKTFVENFFFSSLPSSLTLAIGRAWNRCEMFVFSQEFMHFFFLLD